MQTQPDYQAALSKLRSEHKNNDQKVKEKQLFTERTLSDGLDKTRKITLLKAHQAQNDSVSASFEFYFRELEQQLATGHITFTTATNGKFEQKVEDFEHDLQAIATKLKP